MKWKLDDILKENEFDGLYKEIEKDGEELKKWVKKLSPKMSQDSFKKLLLFEEEIGIKMARLSYLPHLIEAVNQKNKKAKIMKSRAEDLGLNISGEGVKIGLWIQGKRKPFLDDENAKRLFSVIDDLEYSLTRSRKGAKYSLEEREEEIIRHKDAFGTEVLGELREMISTEFSYKIGKKKIKSQAELLALVYSPKRELREAAYKALLNKQKENIDKFFAIYQGIVKDWAYEAKLRGYKNSIEVRNWGNDIPNKAVESLLSVCSDNRKVFWQYFDWKAKELGLKKLKRSDIYAPLIKIDKNYSFEQAKKLVLDAFGEFSENFYNGAQKIINDEHIDVNPGENKRSGAFCATVEPKISPYIMLNFTGKSRDLSTLAHELGHGVHSLLANKHLASVQQANLPLAETASTLAELVLFEKMLSIEKNKKIKKAWLAEKMADAYATICRQNYFVKFEIEAHKRMAEGLNSEKLSMMYLKNLREQFGNSVEIEPIFAYEWSYISHIFESPFYCYAYNFGELLSYSLFMKYKQDKSFLKKIEKLLSSGGSKNPVELLKGVGVKIEEKEFWQKGFDVVKNWQKELERL
ncbi:MAG TPA: M3 family oligoendopeptidase [Candidatus Woesebacteria bacterium]|nr:M3 family oligoendopeptidase [Candidatus Woesebacteria bacterium]